MGLPLPGNTWSPSNLKCLHSFHLHTFGDLVYWDRARTCWSWREINGPQALQGALNTLTLPANTAIPLLPRQAWHFSSGDFLSWATDATEILSTSCVPSTWRHFLTVIYRRWHLLHPAISPPQGTILRTPSRPLVYHGHPRLVSRDLRYTGCSGFPYYACLVIRELLALSPPSLRFR